MQFLTASANTGRSHVLTVLTVLLIMLLHLILWQLIHHPNLSGRASVRDDVVLYLDMLNIALPRPKPPVADTPPVRIVTSVTPTRPVAVRNARQTPPARVPLTAGPTENPVTMSTPNAGADNNIAGNNDNAPSLDLNALRSSAVALERQRKPAEIEQMQASHWRSNTLEKRLGEGTKRAEKKECLKAFSGLGLLAVIPLVVSAVADTGCKW